MYVSSTPSYPSGDSEQAVDGNKDTDFSHGSCSHTKANQFNWFVVALDSSYLITHVNITNRGDCCGRLCLLSHLEDYQTE